MKLPQISLRPFIVIHRVTELAPEWLTANGIRGLLVDIDNTITPYHSEEIPNDILVWLHSIKTAEIKFTPYSNAKPYRIENFCRNFGIPNPGIALKPLNFGLGRTIRILKIPKNQLLLVGDQVFTDNLSGKFAGIRVVLVDPVSTREFPLTKVMRRIERLIGRQKWGYDRLGK